MPKFEYLQTHMSAERFFAEAIEHFNELGDDGWQVFHVHECLMRKEPTFLVYSRREKREVPSSD